MRLCSLAMGLLLCVLWASVANSTPSAEEKKSSGNGKHLELQSKEPAKIKEKVVNDIFQFDNPSHQEMLNNPTLPVKKLPDPEIDQLIDSMLTKMKRHNGGVGISANQVGKSLQISIATDPFDLKHPGNYKVYINPVITSASKEVFCFWHGCLSALDGKFGKVATWREITVTAQDQQGKTVTEDLKGVSAVIFQHEFRHLLGGGYMHHASASRTEAEMFQAMLKGMKEKTFSYLEICKDGEKPLLDDYHVGETIESYNKRVLIKAPDKKQDESKKEVIKKEPSKQRNKKE